MDKVVIITGGSRGIGRKLVEDFARDGYKVAFTYLTNEESSLKLKESLNNSGCQVICKKIKPPSAFLVVFKIILLRQNGC